MKTSKLTRLFSTAAVLAAATVPAAAQEEADTGVFGVEGLGASVSLDVVSQYIFRGYELEDEGLIFQPGASLSLGLTDTEDFTVGAYVGAWQSLHSTPTGAGGDSPGSWFESDLYAGVTLEAGYFSFDLGYIGYFYPSDAFSEIHEIVLTVGFDDSEFLGDWAFSPYIMYAQEIENDNGDENAYLEIGGELGFDLQEEFDLPFSVALPVVAGFSIDTYYLDATGSEEFFGFLSVGAIGTISMSELVGTEDFVGAWDLYGGVTLFLLNAEAAGLKDGTDNDSFNVVGSIGLSREW
ncbi:MAG: TorF family putative porin [Planctomycetota bacterium]